MHLLLEAGLVNFPMTCIERVINRSNQSNEQQLFTISIEHLERGRGRETQRERERQRKRGILRDGEKEGRKRDRQSDGIRSSSTM